MRYFTAGTACRSAISASSPSTLPVACMSFKGPGPLSSSLRRDGDLAASWDAAPISDPHGIFITSDDRVLLVDRNAHQVLIFNTDGRLLATLGERHQPRFGLPFNHPTDVAVAPSGDIYVSDSYGNAHVHWFASDGSYRRSWGGIGSGPGEFSTPHGIWVTTEGRFWWATGRTTGSRSLPATELNLVSGA